MSSISRRDLRQQVQPAARDRRAWDRDVDAAVGGGLVARRCRPVSRSSTAASSAARMPFRSMPLSRSRTPRSACATRTCARGSARVPRRARLAESGGDRGECFLSYASQFTAATLFKVPPSTRGVRVEDAPVGPKGARHAPAGAPGPRKRRHRRPVHSIEYSDVSAYDKIARSTTRGRAASSRTCPSTWRRLAAAAARCSSSASGRGGSRSRRRCGDGGRRHRPLGGDARGGA